MNAARPQTTSATRVRAFTLIEVLLALAIMSVITVALFASLHVAFKARDRSEAALEPVRTSEAVMELVRAELESALPPRGKLVGAFVGTSWQAGNGLDDDELTFYATTTAPAGVFAPGDVKQVQLRTLVEQTTGRRVLVRRVVSNLLSPVLVEPDDEILCRGVASFDVIYYDGLQWWTTWDSTYERDSLPVAVQVTLQLDPPMTRAKRRQPARAEAHPDHPIPVRRRGGPFRAGGDDGRRGRRARAQVPERRTVRADSRGVGNDRDNRP